MEPLIRDADLLSIHLAALKQSDLPAVSHPTPSGFLLEEACKIARYAGMSDKLKAMGIFGFRKSIDRKAQTAQAIAQMIWYFMDGFYHRKNDFPVSTDGLVEYIVDFKDTTSAKEKGLKLRVIKDDGSVKDQVFSKLGSAISLAITSNIVGTNYELSVTNNESYTVDMVFVRLKIT